MKRLFCILLLSALILLHYPSQCIAEESQAQNPTIDNKTIADSYDPVRDDAIVRSFDAVGVSFTFPEEYRSMKGLIRLHPKSGRMMPEMAVYEMALYYYSMSKEEYETFQEKLDEMNDEERAAFSDSEFFLADMIIEKNDVGGVGAFLGGEKIAEADGYTFYLRYGDATTPQLKDGYSYDTALKIVSDAFEHARFHSPKDDPLLTLIGKRVSFESTDLDGNTVMSKELFADNKITLVHYWGTYCVPCVEELPKLSVMHSSLRNKGCGVVGVVIDGEQATEKVKSLLADHETTYPTVFFTDEMREWMDATGVVPTTYFVDSEGTVLCLPTIGPDDYEKTIDGLLTEDGN